MNSISAKKSDMRRQMRLLRRNVGVASESLSMQFNQRLLQWFHERSFVPLCIGAYWPIGYEMDLRPSLHFLHKEGHTIGLPVIVEPDRPLSFRRWSPELSLEQGPFSTQQPPAEEPEVEPDLLLVPLLSFDQEGHRLGYGGGYYDRTIECLRKRGSLLTVGVAFSVQQSENVPFGATDQRLDLAITDSGIFVFGSA